MSSNRRFGAYIHLRQGHEAPCAGLKNVGLVVHSAHSLVGEGAQQQVDRVLDLRTGQPGQKPSKAPSTQLCWSCQKAAQSPGRAPE